MQPSTQFALSTLLFCSLTGCMVGSDAEPTFKTSLRAITKTKWVSCWVRPSGETDPFLQYDAIVCSAPSLGTGAGSPQIVSVLARYGADHFGEARITKTAPVVVARVQRSEFPVQLDLNVYLDTRGLVRSSVNGAGLHTKAMIPAHDSYSNEQALSIEQPFDLWPIEISVESEVCEVALQPYTVELTTGFDVPGTPPATKIETLPYRTSVHSRGDTVTLYALMPHGERGSHKLEGTVYVKRRAPHVNLDLDGPGAYVSSDTGLARKNEAPDSGMGTTTSNLDSCPGSWRDDGVCDRCLVNDPDCSENNTAECEAQWSGDSICDTCLGSDPDCSSGGECPASWRGDGMCDECLGNDPDCAVADECHAYWANDGVCDPCLGPADGDDCTAGILCPIAWRSDGTCDACLGDDPDCESAECPSEWRDDGLCDECLGDDPDCAGESCPTEWRGDGVCDECLGDDPDCTPACPMEWYGDGLCDECLGNDPDCEAGEECPWSWYNDGICDECLGDDPDCGW